MDEAEDGDGDQRIARSLLVARFQKLRVIIKLNGRAGDFPVDFGYIGDELLLVLALPQVFARINHDEVLAGSSDEAVAQGRGQIFNAERSAIVLGSERIEGVSNVIEKRLLKGGQLELISCARLRLVVVFVNGLAQVFNAGFEGG